MIVTQKIIGRFLSVLLACSMALPAIAQQSRLYDLPADGEDLIGSRQQVRANAKDTLIDIARRYRVGYDSIRGANPTVDAWLPREGAAIALPTQTLLPAGMRQGVVINVSEMRLYYYLPAKGDLPPQVAVMPVSIGRGDWNTPLAEARVTRKAKDPSWYPPQSIRDEHAANGDILPKKIEGGPDNPLGRYALYLNLPGYLIHGTNREFGIGMQVTHGCMRLYPEDIEYLFERVPVGTPVKIVHQRIKLGWSKGTLYLEVYPPLDGEHISHEVDREIVRGVIDVETQKLNAAFTLDWDQVQLVLLEASGVPEPIGYVEATAEQQGRIVKE